MRLSWESIDNDKLTCVDVAEVKASSDKLYVTSILKDTYIITLSGSAKYTSREVYDRLCDQGYFKLGSVGSVLLMSERKLSVDEMSNKSYWS